MEEYDAKRIKECLETQLSEVEILQSMFYNPGEIHFDDHTVIAEITEFVNDTTTILPPYLDFIINLPIDSINFELCVTLPHEYPQTEPDIFVRSNKQTRQQQRKLNNNLTDYIKEIERGDICIYSIITWLQENASSYINAEPETPSVSKIEDTSNACARYWIYSHHIYSKTKRREILNLADEYGLSGFCLPGKPGVVCIEGLESDCNTWWMNIRSMTWKRIVCKHMEKEICEDMTQFRKFGKFQELSFHCEGNRGNHMSLGDLLKFMEGHDCGNMFKELFGLDGKSG